jgi:hypothetical protein
MPTAVEFTPVPKGGVGFFTRGYRVPQDDDHAIRYNLTAIPRIEGFVRRGRPNSVKSGPTVQEVSRDLVEGREDMASLKARGDTLDGFFLTNVQDCSVLSSLGAPADRDFPENLGGCDVSMAMMRRLFIREMTNLTAGKPLKEWKRPEYLWKDVTALHREMMTS